jgi:small subunit ribosomal protein S8
MKKEKSRNKIEKSMYAGRSGVTNYPVGDFLIRIKNAAIAKNHDLVVTKTSLVKEVAKILEKSGYISSLREEGDNLSINLTYIKKEPVLMDIKLISKPGLRVYKNVKGIKEHRGPSLLIVSTPRGLMTGAEALKSNVGGEIIAEVK